MLRRAIMQALGSTVSHQLSGSSRPVYSIALMHTAAKTAARPRVRASNQVVSAPTILDTKQLDELVNNRRKLERRSPYGLLHIKGVTFEGRQELIKQLVPGQPVMLVKDPSNPYDPLAVQIKTLDGQFLGHVSRNINNRLPLQITFGSVYSVGEGASGNWGALVSYCPSLPGLSLEFLPHSWSQQMDVQKILGAEAWQQLHQRCVANYDHRCAISSTHSAPNDANLQIIPRWCFDYEKQQVSLTDFMPVSSTLADVHKVLDTSHNASADRQEALRVLSHVMNWLDSETAKYVAFAERQRQQVEQEGWKLEQITRETCLQLVLGPEAEVDFNDEQADEDEDETQNDRQSV